MDGAESFLPNMPITPTVESSGAVEPTLPGSTAEVPQTELLIAPSITPVPGTNNRNTPDAGVTQSYSLKELPERLSTVMGQNNPKSYVRV